MIIEFISILKLIGFNDIKIPLLSIQFIHSIKYIKIDSLTSDLTMIYMDFIIFLFRLFFIKDYQRYLELNSMSCFAIFNVIILLI